jgi:formylglycine-generating enzyme required for sulfatase activity
MKRATLQTRAAVGRADLLRVYAEHGEQALELAALALGYGRQQAMDTIPCTAATATASGVRATIISGPPPLPERPPTLPAARFFHVTEHLQSDPPPGAGPEAPDWLARARALADDTCPAPGSVRFPARQPLTRWSRLWPFLRSALGQTVASRQPDLPRLLDRLTRGEVLRAIPMLRRHGWSPRIAILSDHSRQTVPFHGDFSALNHAIERRHGKLGLERYILHGEPGTQPQVRKPLHSATQRWQLRAATTPLLILSDLGLIDGAPETLRGWQQFGGRLRSAGCPALVLCPVPARLHPASLQRYFEIVEWDRHSPLRRSLTQVASDAGATGGQAEHSADKLLSLLAPAVLVEPTLLRAIRHLLPAREADVLAEALAWQHPDVQSGALGFQFAGAAAIEKYQRKFAELPPPQQEAAVRLIVTHHAGLPESVRLGELATSQRLAPHCALARDARLVERWQHDIARTALEHPDSAALQQWLNRHIGRQTGAMFADNEALAALWALAQRQRLTEGEVLELPPGVQQQEVAFFLRPEPARHPVRCRLRQRGQELRLEVLTDGTDGTAADNASPYAELTLVDGGVFVRVTQLGEAASDGSNTEASAGAPLRYIAAESLPQTIARLGPDIERVELRSEHLELSISALTRPAWAKAIGRDARGLFAEVDWLEQRCRLDWQPPQPGQTEQSEQRGQSGRWTSEQPLGVDRYGLFAEIAVAGVSQRFRWMAPGHFLMGSPPEEPEREDDEVQHEVRLSRGFWLADTTCTQALWQAVTGANPSEFQDDVRNPVENVSWNDVQTFLSELNRRVPGLQARLPSEAEWEYACRAGTTTPFSFGDKITPEQVNYNGNQPYAGAEKGLYRQKTMPVGSLPANPWGLYEMHGNVWEWCADWYGDYPSTPQVDPTGPQTGDSRVLRGGSWFYLGGFARCAFRFGYVPDDRGRHIGFRFAPGQSGPAEPAGRVSEKSLAEPATLRSGPAEPAPTARLAGSGGTPPTLTERIKRWFKDR